MSNDNDTLNPGAAREFHEAMKGIFARVIDDIDDPIERKEMRKISDALLARGERTILAFEEAADDHSGIAEMIIDSKDVALCFWKQRELALQTEPVARMITYLSGFPRGEKRENAARYLVAMTKFIAGYDAFIQARKTAGVK